MITNTIYLKDDKLIGDNTDYFCFEYMLEKSKIDIHNKYGLVSNNNLKSYYNTLKSFLDNGFIIKEKFDAKKYQMELSSKLDTLISTVKTNYTEAKEREAAALQESKSKINSTDFNLINYIPARLQESWMKLSDERKKEILAESKMFIIKEEASAVYFWNTRDLRENRIESVKIEENVVPNENKELVNESVLADDSFKMMAEKIKYNMRRY
mgnify:CR=1 FL=1